MLSEPELGIQAIEVEFGRMLVMAQAKLLKNEYEIRNPIKISDLTESTPTDGDYLVLSRKNAETGEYDKNFKISFANFYKAYILQAG